MQIKIADLGFARELKVNEIAETILGTPLVMAPEVLCGHKYNHKADVWSLGIVFFELLTGFMPFTGRNRDDLKKNILDGTYKMPKKLNLRLSCISFINSCLQSDPELRYSWEQLVNDPYLNGTAIDYKNDFMMSMSYS